MVVLWENYSLPCAVSTEVAKNLFLKIAKTIVK